MDRVATNERDDRFRRVIRIDEGQIRSRVDQPPAHASSKRLTPRPTPCAGPSGMRGVRTGWTDTRAGSYQRQVQTMAGELTLTVPRFRKLPFETRIIERYRRREASVEEALIEKCLSG